MELWLKLAVLVALPLNRWPCTFLIRSILCSRISLILLSMLFTIDHHKLNLIAILVFPTPEVVIVLPLFISNWGYQVLVISIIIMSLEPTVSIPILSFTRNHPKLKPWDQRLFRLVVLWLTLRVRDSFPFAQLFLLLLLHLLIDELVSGLIQYATTFMQVIIVVGVSLRAASSSSLVEGLKRILCIDDLVGVHAGMWVGLGNVMSRLGVLNSASELTDT